MWGKMCFFKQLKSYLEDKRRVGSTYPPSASTAKMHVHENIDLLGATNGLRCPDVVTKECDDLFFTRQEVSSKSYIPHGGILFFSIMSNTLKIINKLRESKHVHIGRQYFLCTHSYSVKLHPFPSRYL
jgi:hypothetical protein